MHYLSATTAWAMINRRVHKNKARMGTVLNRRYRTGRFRRSLNTTKKKKLKQQQTADYQRKYLGWGLRVFKRLICRDRYTWTPVK